MDDLYRELAARLGQTEGLARALKEARQREKEARLNLDLLRAHGIAYLMTERTHGTVVAWREWAVPEGRVDGLDVFKRTEESELYELQNEILSLQAEFELASQAVTELIERRRKEQVPVRWD